VNRIVWQLKTQGATEISGTCTAPQQGIPAAAPQQRPAQPEDVPSVPDHAALASSDLAATVGAA
jgi:hypothetical protein